jgi:hypothetical protein
MRSLCSGLALVFSLISTASANYLDSANHLNTINPPGLPGQSSSPVTPPGSAPSMPPWSISPLPSLSVDPPPPPGPTFEPQSSFSPCQFCQSVENPQELWKKIFAEAEEHDTDAAETDAAAVEGPPVGGD